MRMIGIHPGADHICCQAQTPGLPPWPAEAGPAAMPACAQGCTDGMNCSQMSLTHAQPTSSSTLGTGGSTCCSLTLLCQHLDLTPGADWPAGSAINANSAGSACTPPAARQHRLSSPSADARSKHQNHSNSHVPCLLPSHVFTAAQAPTCCSVRSLRQRTSTRLLQPSSYHFRLTVSPAPKIRWNCRQAARSVQGHCKIRQVALSAHRSQCSSPA